MKCMPAIGLFLIGCASRSTSLSSAPRARPLVEAEAQEIVLQLPEVNSFFKFLDRETSGKVRGMIFVDGQDEDSWSFYVGEDHDDHTTVWEQFNVNRKTGSIKVLDAVSADWITLADWRKSRTATHN